MKRGTDHTWETVKYKGNIAIYARCKCGFIYCCSHSIRNSDGTWSFKQNIDNLYPYCPICGARKKYYTTEPKQLNQ